MKDELQRRRKVLVCDDQEGVREALKLILEDEYDLSFARDGVEAVEMLQRAAFDAAILDVKMPRMNGIEALAKIRQINPQTKTILISAYKVSGEAGTKFIEKPFNAQVILRTVREAVQESQPQ